MLAGNIYEVSNKQTHMERLATSQLLGTAVILVFILFVLGFANAASSQVVDASGQFLGKPGDSAAIPSFSWKNDTDTGMFRAGANGIGFSTDGTKRLTIDSSGITTSGGYTQTGLWSNAFTGPTFFKDKINANGSITTFGLLAYSPITLGSMSGTSFDGAILFTDSNGQLTQDKVNFTWDDANNRLNVSGLTVGKSATPKGITLFDEDTGAAFCIKVKSGALAATPGSCI